MKTMFDYFKLQKYYNVERFVLEEKQYNTYNAALQYHENPHWVLDRINSRPIRRSIIKDLISIDYDFKTSFPYDVDILQKYHFLSTVRDNLIKEKKYYEYYIKAGKTFFTVNNLKALLCKTNKKLTPYVFRFDYDLFINYCQGSYYIILNPKYKYGQQLYTLNNLYNKLNKIESNVWVTWDTNSTVLKTKENLYSKIPVNLIRKFIKNFNLKY